MTDRNWGPVSEEDPTRPSEEDIVCGRVVIAADGIRSRYRQEIYRAIGGDHCVPCAHPVNNGMMMVLVFIDGIPKGAEDAFEKLWNVFPGRVVFLSASDASARIPYSVLIRLPENKAMIVYVANLPQSLASNAEECLNEIVHTID